MSTVRFRLLLILVTLLAPSCASLRLREKTYALEGPRKYSVNGADFFVQLEGLGGGKGAFSLSAMVYSAAATSTTGPYECALFAVGRAGRHASMTIHSLRLSTPQGGTREFTSGLIDLPIPFSPTRRDGVVQAVYHLPGEIRAVFGRDSELRIDARVSVATTDGREEKKLLRMPLTPLDRTRTEFIVVPAEIYNSITHGGVPFEDSDVGVNRSGWKGGTD